MRSLGVSADVQAKLVARIFSAVIYMIVMWESGERSFVRWGFD